MFYKKIIDRKNLKCLYLNVIKSVYEKNVKDKYLLSAKIQLFSMYIGRKKHLGALNEQILCGIKCVHDCCSQDLM